MAMDSGKNSKTPNVGSATTAGKVSVVAQTAASVRRARILLVEKSRDFANQLRQLLDANGALCDLVRVDNRPDFDLAIKHCEFDLIIADHFDTAVDGVAVLTRAKDAKPPLTVVLLATKMSKEMRNSLLTQGAAGVALKHDLVRLPGLVRSLVATADQARARIPTATKAVSSNDRDPSGGQWSNTSEQLSAIFSAFPDDFFVLKADGTVVDYHLGQADNLFANPENIIGRHLSETLPHSVAPLFQDALNRSLATRATISFEFSTSFNGSDQHLEARLVPLSEAQVFACMRNVTDRKSVEAQLRESNRRLENALSEVKTTQRQIVQQERLHALGQMAAGIAHDFNNSLMSILGFSELLLMHPENLDNRHKVLGYLKTINTAADDSSKIVKRLSEFYRHREEGEVFPPLEINSLIRQVITLTQPKWKDQAQSVGVVIDIQSDLRDVPLVSGNAAELRECLTNLILNAVDAMPVGGKLTLRTTATEKHVIVEVADSGTGMTEEVRKRCFEPFFSTKGQRGSGLGLAVVFGILQRHHATIEVQSETGRGTRFLIQFPAEKASEVPFSDDATKATRSLRILVVDDEPLIREVLVEYLQSDGHSVVTACDGREGLQRFGERHFDLVLTDKSMPNMTGDNMAAAIKQIAPTKPIILLTGFGEMMKAAGQKPEGVDVIVSKPISLNTLRRTLADAVVS